MIKFFQLKLGEIEEKIRKKSIKIEGNIRKETIFKIKIKKIEEKEMKRRRKEFLKKLQEEKVIRENKKKKVIEEENERLRKEAQEKERLEKEEQEKIKFQKEKELNENHNKSMIEKEYRKNIFYEGQLRYLSVKNQKPLYKKIEESYLSNKIFTEKINYQRSLSHRKEQFKPIILNEIISHEAEYLKHLHQTQSLRKKKMRNNKIDRMINESNLSFYQPKIKNILEMEKQIELQEQKMKRDLKLALLDKQKNYGKIAQELYSYSTPIKFQQRTPVPKLKKIYEPSIDISKFIPKKKKIHEEKSEKNLKKNKNGSKSTISTSKSVDYINENKKRSIKNRGIVLPSIGISDFFKEDQEGSGKIKMIQQITRKLDSQTKLLENMCKPNHITVMESEMISSAYINSIQTKLALLNKLESN